MTNRLTQQEIQEMMEYCEKVEPVHSWTVCIRSRTDLFRCANALKEAYQKIDELRDKMDRFIDNMIKCTCIDSEVRNFDSNKICIS